MLRDERLISRFFPSFRTKSSFQRVSTLVTTIFDGPVESKIEIAITFYDLVMAPNDTRLNNLRCARVHLPKEINENTIYEAFWDGRVWDVDTVSCRIESRSDGITCVCDKAGMYALINQINEDQVRQFLNPNFWQ